jgi:hypothetical protein
LLCGGTGLVQLCGHGYGDGDVNGTGDDVDDGYIIVVVVMITMVVVMILSVQGHPPIIHHHLLCGGTGHSNSVMLQWYYNGTTVLLQWWFSVVTVLVQWCYRDITVMLQWQYRGVAIVSISWYVNLLIIHHHLLCGSTRLSQLCVVTMVLDCRYSVDSLMVVTDIDGYGITQ